MPVSPSTLRLSVHEWTCIRTELLWAYDAAIPRDALHKTVSPETGLRAIYLRRGRLIWTTSRQRFEVSAGQWLMVPPEGWTQEFTEDAKVISLYFACEWPSGVNLLSHQGVIIPGTECPELHQLAGKLAAAVARLYPMTDGRELTRQSSDFGDFLNQQSLFLQWLRCWFRVLLERGSTLSTLKLAGDERPLRAASLLNQAPLESGFPKERLLQEIGLGEVQINRLFLQEFGLTLRRYWDGRRLQVGKSLLETTSLSVKELSYRLGFLSDSHFVTWFRRQSGKTPNEFRGRLTPS